MLNGKSKLEVGVVGLGKMGVMHACLLNTFGNVEVKALCDKSRLMRTIAKHAFPHATVVSDLTQFASLNLDVTASANCRMKPKRIRRVLC